MFDVGPLWFQIGVWMWFKRLKRKSGIQLAGGRQLYNGVFLF
jgi:hypothetical protein